MTEGETGQRRAMGRQAGERGKKRGPVFRTVKRLRLWLNRVLAAHSEVGDPAVFDNDVFPWIGNLERHWPAIRAEVEALVRSREEIPAFHDVSPDQYKISKGEQWRSFFLWGFGYTVPANCARCPQTTWALDCVPGLTTAFFSILAPGTHIPRHQGVSKRLINCHLALIVPRQARPGTEGCRIAVDDKIFRWEEGKCLVFDDTYPHEVWNDTAETRVVLFLQFKRPLRQPGRVLGDLFLAAVRHSPYVQEARRNITAWEAAQQRIERN
ncbi:aspartyl/asparaginyl beta-hydroxylase domain-containing protein [Dongia soli]|uniref:aspartyl/asparaginyl beta-hydroxylase domain-containing protein n=1 Tax=Dongia soli TaxID=600628 RepID=UPI00360A7EDE